MFGNTGLDEFPLLVKIIDAKGHTSVQVHLDDNYAKLHENGSLGKTECWYILDSKEESNIVVGHNAHTDEEFKDMLYNGRWDDLIREVHVEKDDFIQSEPGTIALNVSGEWSLTALANMVVSPETAVFIVFEKY